MGEYIIDLTQIEEQISAKQHFEIPTSAFREELVRCSKCKYFDNMPTERGWYTFCIYGGYMRLVKSNDFCSYGEAK